MLRKIDSDEKKNTLEKNIFKLIIIWTLNNLINTHRRYLYKKKNHCYCKINKVAYIYSYLECYALNKSLRWNINTSLVYKIIKTIFRNAHDYS